MTKTIEQRVAALEKQLGTKKRTTRIVVVQDDSTSMGDRTDATINGFNEYVTDLATDDSDKAYLTLVQFNTRYKVVYKNKNVKRAPKLNRDTYHPNGMTALYDAVGRAINDLKNTLEDDERALVVIMTDGMENSSREFTQQNIQKMIRDCEEEGNWTFVFLGAGPDSWTGGRLLGINASQVINYGTDQHSHSVGYSGLAAATRGMRSGTASSAPQFGAAVMDSMSEEGATVVPKQSSGEQLPLWTPGSKNGDDDGSENENSRS